ncbi:MAG: hypothetical protein L6Q57_08925 [Alphaproteobacteria bacterium]|nr:hypothetical protein [Alphaproteobacteria bacterium]
MGSAIEQLSQNQFLEVQLLYAAVCHDFLQGQHRYNSHQEDMRYCNGSFIILPPALSHVLLTRLKTLSDQQIGALLLDLVFYFNRRFDDLLHNARGKIQEDRAGHRAPNDTEDILGVLDQDLREEIILTFVLEAMINTFYHLLPELNTPLWQHIKAYEAKDIERDALRFNVRPHKYLPELISSFSGYTPRPPSPPADSAGKPQPS